MSQLPEKAPAVVQPSIPQAVRASALVMARAFLVLGGIRVLAVAAAAALRRAESTPTRGIS